MDLSEILVLNQAKSPCRPVTFLQQWHAGGALRMV